MVNAVVQNDVARVAKLLDARQNVNACNESSETAFSYACANNAFEVAKLLHARGANVNTIDAGNGSPLDWAVYLSSPEFCAWLKSIGGKRHDVWPDRNQAKSKSTPRRAKKVKKKPK
jgi:ankyrin repeat protein